MLDSILKRCSAINIYPDQTKLLVAVSGGMDSMVLLDVLRRLSFNLEIAHVNYKLRGLDSELDMQLVQKVGDSNSILVHILETTIKDDKNIQIEARNLRRQFFIDVAKKRKCHFISTAHHQNDQVETILLSIFKGYPTQRMEMINDIFIKPILDISKEDIEDYALKNSIDYREDTSNKEIKYDRNFIRNNIIPILEPRFPNLYSKLLSKSKREKKAHLNLHIASQRIACLYISEKKGFFAIQKQQFHDPSDIIFVKIYIKTTFSFSEDQVEKMFMEGNPMAKFESSDWLAIRGTKELFIGSKSTTPIVRIIEAEDKETKTNEFHIQFKQINPSDLPVKSLLIDLDKIAWPITFRTIMANDRICPKGMSGKQKSVHKILREKGFNYFEIRRFIVLEDRNNRKILPGVGISEFFAPDYKTKRHGIVFLQDKRVN